jgi:uncharacterized peroxidase-related enzyme
MAVLRAIESQDAPERVKAVFAALERTLGRVPAMIHLMANSPPVLDAYLHFNHGLEGTTLSAETRALITVAIAEMSGCDYTLSLGMALAKRQGVTDAALQAARFGRSPETKTDDTLQFATSIVRHSGRVPQTDIEGLRKRGFSDQEIVDIIAAVALNIFRNYFNLVAGTDIDSVVVRAMRGKQAAGVTGS